ncbi:MAG: hypothetical protein LBM12_01145 [Candidatus Nomurabacteria bacterium]|jgi:hypothetical protein|nr:hypothetical protein [Candidatus Nomurabacteria bacterium]
MKGLGRYLFSMVAGTVLAFLPSFAVVRTNTAFAAEEILAPETATSAPVANETAPTNPIRIAAVAEKVASPEVEQPAPSTPKVSKSCPWSMTIGDNELCITATDDLRDDPRRGVKNYDGQFGEDFLFAHNTKEQFGPLLKAQTFSITKNGKTEQYQIVKTEIVCDAANINNNGKEKQKYDCTGNQYPELDMAEVIQHTGYDFSLMTCYGKMLGSGDASHRVVAYANKI